MADRKTVTEHIRKRIDAETGDKDTEYVWIQQQYEWNSGTGFQELGAENQSRIEHGLKPVIKTEREGG